MYYPKSVAVQNLELWDPSRQLSEKIGPINALWEALSVIFIFCAQYLNKGDVPGFKKYLMETLGSRILGKA